MSTAASPTVDLGAFVGYQYPDDEVAWNRRDTIIYALSIGAHLDERDIIYEKDPKFQVFPTFATTLSFKGTNTDVFDFAERFAGEKKPDGWPSEDVLKSANLVQASQYWESLAPIPADSSLGFVVKKTIIGVHEAADGVTIDNEIVLADTTGKEYARMVAQAKYLGCKVNGVAYEKVDRGGMPPQPPIATLGRPKWTAKGPTLETQTALYRLNGDYNPLHIDPAFGAKTIYGGVILHGLCMYSITGRAILEKLSEKNPANLKAMSALFIGPIKPGDTLQIKLWDQGPAPAPFTGATKIAFEARTTSGSLCLGEGMAYVVVTAVVPETDPGATAFDPSTLENPPVVPPVIPANGPHVDTNYGPLIFGIPIRALIPLLFWAPVLILNLLYVTLSYLFTWWWQW